MLYNLSLVNTYWSYDKGGAFSMLDDDGEERPQTRLLVRTYPVRIAGTPVSFNFDRQTMSFELVFEEDKAVTDPTEIFVPQADYPNGFDVELSDGDYEFDASTSVLRYFRDKDIMQHNIRILSK